MRLRTFCECEESAFGASVHLAVKVKQVSERHVDVLISAYERYDARQLAFIWSNRRFNAYPGMLVS